MTSFTSILASIIVGVLALRLSFFVWYLIRAYILTKVGFYKDLRKYGEWAVVTGSSDGIGKEYAKQLARYGLNIILISRTESKLQKVAEEIKKESNVEVRVIVFDFTKVLEYGKLIKELECVDIGVLVNNVGLAIITDTPFQELDVEDHVRIMNVNMISDVRMTHMVLPGMIHRKRGAIVHLSSIGSLTSVSGLSVYAGSKVFINKFVASLVVESKGLIEHQVVMPGSVESKMSGKKPSALVPTAKDFVASAIKTIGVVNVTCGCLTHDLLLAVIQYIPSSILSVMHSKDLKKEE